MAENVINVTDDNFKLEVLESDLPTMVDFWAQWCGPCRQVGPVIEELATEYAGKAKICKMNVEESAKIPAEYGITAIPTVFVFKAGEIVQTVQGARPKGDFKKALDAAIGG